MFPLHDFSRQRVTRALFWLLCVAPTSATLAWGMWLNRPGHVAAGARELSETLGVEAKFERVTYPVPGMTLIRRPFAHRSRFRRTPIIHAYGGSLAARRRIADRGVATRSRFGERRTATRVAHVDAQDKTRTRGQRADRGALPGSHIALGSDLADVHGPARLVRSDRRNAASGREVLSRTGRLPRRSVHHRAGQCQSRGARRSSSSVESFRRMPKPSSSSEPDQRPFPAAFCSRTTHLPARWALRPLFKATPSGWRALASGKPRFAGVSGTSTSTSSSASDFHTP